jgi:23S rRNA (cytosine1962-C5)-methyltransferase
MAKFYLRKKVSDRVINGHPWIFGNELGDSEGECEAGDIVEVYTSNGSFVGKGYVNPASQIRIRLVTRDKNEMVDDQFCLGISPADWLRGELPPDIWRGRRTAGAHHR